MILVSGATGKLGAETVAQLLRVGAKNRFAVLARDAVKAQTLAAQGLEVRIADFDQPQSLTSCFAGVKKFLFISTMAMNRAEQQSGVVDAAVEAGVKHIVYTGLAIRDIERSSVRDVMASHFQTEDRIRRSGVAYTFLRNTMYAEAMAPIIGTEALAVGIALPAGTGRVPYALRTELGEAAANVLLQDHHVGMTYHLTGNAAHGYADVAQAFSLLTDRCLSYRNISPYALRESLEGAGMPAFLIHLTLGTLQDIKTGQYEIPSRDLANLLGRAPRSLQGMLRSVFPDPG